MGHRKKASRSPQAGSPSGKKSGTPTPPISKPHQCVLPAGNPSVGGGSPTFPGADNRLLRAVVLGLVGLTVVAYWGVWNLQFVHFDDATYVWKNPHVLGGLNWENFFWAFNIGAAGNWHPLTWWSHMLDVTLFGLDAGKHHLVNLLFHVANSLLVFWVAWRLFGEDSSQDSTRARQAVWACALVAALFAIHPMHVESVAWIAERKDVLSSFFGLLSLGVYVGYARCPSWRGYLAVLGLLGLGLMAKPMLVTLPCVFVLLDLGPLNRRGGAGEKQPESWGWLLGEKLPLAALSVGSCAITFLAQHRGGAVATITDYALGERLANAAVSYVRYLGKAFWPLDLSVFYPYPPQQNRWVVAGAVLALLLVSGAVAAAALRGRRYAALGWLWYLGMLVPVIGLVQVGDQAMADRYSYLPFVGLFILLVWGAMDLLGPLRQGRWILGGMAIVALVNCAVITPNQLSYWHDSETLLRHALAVDSNCPMAHNNLGVVAWDRKDYHQAIEHWLSALTLCPTYSDAHTNLARARIREGRIGDAAEHLRTAILIKPTHAGAHNNLGVILWQQGRVQESLEHLREALRLEPENTDAHHNLARICISLRKFDEAQEHLREVLRLEPGSVSAKRTFGLLEMDRGRFAESERWLREVLEARPASLAARMELVHVLLEQKRWSEAVSESQQLRLPPGTVAVLAAVARLMTTVPEDVAVDLLTSATDFLAAPEAKRNWRAWKR